MAKPKRFLVIFFLSKLCIKTEILEDFEDLPKSYFLLLIWAVGHIEHFYNP